MVNRTHFISAPVGIIALLCIVAFTVKAQQPGVSKVPVTISTFVSTAPCFNEMTVHAFEVGKEVASLGGVLSFCTNFKILSDRGRARIILVLDNSASMCQEVTSCAGASNNDPTNKRIFAAMTFVDSLAGMCPDCQVGVISYTGVGNDSTGMHTIMQSMTPVPLNDSANIAALHSVINSGQCGGRIAKIGKLAKRTLTFTGMALDSAIKMVDAGFDTLPSMNRHIILLTDGDWQKPTTSQILSAYAAGHPGWKMPTIHGVFISDSAGHVAAGFPPNGLVTCTETEKIPVDLSYLQLAASATGGKYFPGSTPQTIVSVFTSLLSNIIEVDTSFCCLMSITFTNKNTGEQRAATFVSDTAYPLGGHYKVHVPPFDLAYGLNTFIMTRIGPDSNSVRVTINDTVTIYRKTTTGTAANPAFKTESGTDTVGLSIGCKPASLLPGGFDTVTIATADARDTGIFKPNSVIVRAFVPFPDDGDARTLALFHLDNSLANSAPNGKPGMGTPLYSGNAAFGSAISLSEFRIELAAIRGDFTFECWIKPSTPYQTDWLFDGSNLFFMLKHGYLFATIGHVSFQVESVIDFNVWQHVALARRDGLANIYVNGIPRTAGVSAPDTLVGGVYTMSDDVVGTLDEVRISTCVRTSEIQGTTVLQIPCAENLQWKIGNATSALPSATIPSSLWQSVHKGQAQFQVTSLVPGPMIVNFLDMLSSPSYIWSVNGEPIAFGTSGSPVKNTAQMKPTSRNPELKVFDARGKLLGKGTKFMLRSKALDFQGIYFVKYQDGRIERRMNLSQYGNSVR
jgi:hypothetical protein